VQANWVSLMIVAIADYARCFAGVAAHICSFSPQATSVSGRIKMARSDLFFEKNARYDFLRRRLMSHDDGSYLNFSELLFVDTTWHYYEYDHN
jgi:hypothetical protein